MSQPVTFNQLCLFLLTIAAVLLVQQLVQTLSQFRRTLTKTDDAVSELRATLSELRQLTLVVRTRVQSLSAVLEGFERCVGKLASAIDQVATYILRPFIVVSGLLGGLKAAFGSLGRKGQGGDANVRR